jgi:hyperosmotically inducible protein
MRNAYVLAIATGLALGVACWGGLGRAQQEGVGEKAGEKIDEVGRKFKKGLDKAEDAVRESFHKSRAAVHSMGVAARVYGRLHWDKSLNSSTLDVKVEDGVATLSGSVATAEAKAKATTLAAETVGVTRVVEQLTIPASEADRAATPKP